MSGKAIADMSAKELKAYIESKCASYKDCTEKSELRARATSVSDNAVVLAMLKDVAFCADASHWLVGSIEGILHEPCGVLPSGDSHNAFHLRKRFEGFRQCYPGVQLDAWIDSIPGFEAYLSFARFFSSVPHTPFPLSSYCFP